MANPLGVLGWNFSLSGGFGNWPMMIFWSVLALLITGMLVFAVIYYLKRRKYKIKCIIHSERGGNKKLLEDKGAYLIDPDGAEVFRLLKAKVIIEPPPFNYLTVGPKGNYLELYQRGLKEFIPIRSNFVPTKKIKVKLKDGKIIEKEVGILDQKPEDKARDLWRITMAKRRRETWKLENFMEKYGGYMVLVFLFGAGLILFYMITKNMDGVARACTACVDAAGKAAELARTSIQPTA